MITKPMSKWGLVLALCTSVAMSCACAHESAACRQLSEAVGGPDDNFRPPVSATVIGLGRAYFHSAPAPECLSKQTFIVPGDAVTVYKPYKKWYQVMYTNVKTGRDVEGWIEEGRLRLGGPLGDNQ